MSYISDILESDEELTALLERYSKIDHNDGDGPTPLLEASHVAANSFYHDFTKDPLKVLEILLAIAHTFGNVYDLKIETLYYGTGLLPDIDTSRVAILLTTFEEENSVSAGWDIYLEDLLPLDSDTDWEAILEMARAFHAQLESIWDFSETGVFVSDGVVEIHLD